MGVKKITSHCFLLGFLLESVGLNALCATFVKFSLIIEADGNVFFIKHLGLMSLISLFISVMFLIIGCMENH